MLQWKQFKAEFGTRGSGDPSVAPAIAAAPGRAAQGRGCGRRAGSNGRGEKNNTQGNYLRDFDFCTNLALKRAQLSLHLSTSASNYVKKNIIVLLTLMLVVSSRDR